MVGPLGPLDRRWDAEALAALIDAVEKQTFLLAYINTEEKNRSDLKQPDPYQRMRDLDEPVHDDSDTDD